MVIIVKNGANLITLHLYSFNPSGTKIIKIFFLDKNLEGFRYLFRGFIILLERFRYLSRGFIIPLEGFRHLYRVFIIPLEGFRYLYMGFKIPMERFRYPS